MRDAQLEPDYVYEENPPEVEEMQCPEEQFLSCAKWFDREELLNHYEQEHSQYSGMDKEAVDVIFEQERTRRYGR